MQVAGSVKGHVAIRGAAIQFESHVGSAHNLNFLEQVVVVGWCAHAQFTILNEQILSTQVLTFERVQIVRGPQRKLSSSIWGVDEYGIT